MIPAIFYKYVWLFLITILTVVTMRVKRLPFEKELPIFGWFWCIIVILLIGFRPVSGVFVDMMNYYENWLVVSWNGFDLNAENLLFDNLFAYMAGGMNLDIRSFFVLIAAIYFGGILVACKKFFPNHLLLSFVVCLSAFSTYSYGTNGIKAGAAASLFLVSLAYRDKIWVSIIFLLFSWGFHHSMQLPIVAYMLTFIFKKKEWYFYGWLFCLLMAIGHISFFQNLFAGMTDEQGTSYLSGGNNDWGGRIGFRIDFVLYSAMPILMGYYVKYKYRLKDVLYDTMLHVYLVCNGVWMLCMYASFTNRIAYLSWFMYPILIVYPCFAINDLSHPLVVNRNKIIMAHLCFTLFMTLVYYA